MRTKLERIDRILSTKRSADILKYQQGAKFIAIGLGQTLYSPNGANWYTDLGLTTPTSIVDLNAYQISLLNPVITNGLNIINNPNNITNNPNYSVTSNTLSAIGGIGTALGAYQKTEDSRLTRGLDTGYDFIAENAANYGPYGLMVSGAMKTAGAITDATLALGLKTDLQTKFDQVFGSKFLALTPTGIINSGFGKESNDFSMDREVMEKVGGGYIGTVNDMYDLEELAGKRYGLFSSKARQRVNEAIAGMQNKQGQLENIGTEAELQRLNVKSGVEQSRLSYENMINGGYGQKYTYSAKEGGILEWEPVIELEWTPDFQEGGELEWNPLFNNKTRTIDELIEYAKKENPRFIQRLFEEPKIIKFIDDEGNEAEGSHYLEWGSDSNNNAIVYPRIQEVENGGLKFLNSEDAYKQAIENNNILIMSPEEADIFFSEDPEYGVAYKKGWPNFFKKFKKGGKTDEKLPLDPGFEIKDTTQKNVIPEGALHKNKHHMEHAECLTKKGIPVVDNDGNLQAEIEHSEIVFNLQTTKDLEELYKIFYSYEASLKEKDKAAIDAGKILVEQILFNTDDRTQLIESCKNGGLLNNK